MQEFPITAVAYAGDPLDIHGTNRMPTAYTEYRHTSIALPRYDERPQAQVRVQLEKALQASIEVRSHLHLVLRYASLACMS